MAAVTLLNENTRLALLPLTVKFIAPGPAMVRLLVITNCPPVSVMVPVTAKSMVSPGAALAMASRREQWSTPGTPSSVSSVELTVRTEPVWGRSPTS